MSFPTSARTGSPAPRLARIPAYRTIPRLARDRLRAFTEIGRECDGALARVDLGLTRPYLVTHPDHVQHVLRRPETYRREGMMWRPLRRLQGWGIAGEGPSWQTSRRILQPRFTARHIDSLLRLLASAVTETRDRLAARAGDRPVDVTTEMTRMTHRGLTRAFFSDRISLADSDRLGEAIAAAFQSLGARMLLPFVGDAVPLPGDRGFRRAVRTVDEIVYPLIQACRSTGDQDGNLVALLAQAVDEAGEPLGDRRIRDDVVAMFVAGTETTALALTWLWLLVDAHPEVAARLAGEVAEVVGDAAPDPAHLPGLEYTRMVFQEVLRLYPGGWVLPRTVAEPDVLDGTRLRPGDTVLLSPYLTHRMPAFWPDPEEFRPERFAPDRTRGRHRFAYFPFGAGAHQCLGSHFAVVEGQLIVAGLLGRFRPELVAPRSLRARVTVTLEPRDPPRMVLHPPR